MKSLVLSIILALMAGRSNAVVAQQVTDTIFQIRDLDKGKPIERAITAADTHYYRIKLKAGEFLRALVDQRGIDLIITLYAPDGQKILEVDSPNGIQGPEPIVVEAKTSGPYRIEVRPLEKNVPPGRYEVRIEEILTAEQYAARGRPAVFAEQVADTAFRPPIDNPAYPLWKGPVVLIDEAHFNFHTATGRYLPFATLLRRDGYLVMASAARFTAESLRPAKVLVISNALNEKNQNDWEPSNPSAFTDEEIAVVRDWVAGGGSLLLIADHAPFAGAAEDLAKALGVRFRSGIAANPGNRSGRLVFRRSDGTLMDHAVTKGIDSVATFAGSSFQMDAPGQPLLVFGPKVYSYTEQKDSVLVKGHFQGAVLPFGKGRVAVFGEAAMFSAQLTGLDRHPMGMNASIAKQNPQFLLNVMYWLTGVIR